VLAGHEVLIEVDNTISLIVDNPQRVLDHSSGLALAVVHAGNKVLMEVDDTISLIVGNPQRVLDQQLKPHLIHLLMIYN
jgi:hypothetical protein